MNYLIDYKGAYARCMHIPHNQRFKILLRMKLLIISLLFFLVQAAAAVRSQTLTLHFTNAPLEQVLTEIKKQTGYSYIANARLLKEAKTVTVSVRNAHVDDALKAIFKDQSLSAEVKDGVIRIEAKKGDANQRKTEAVQDVIRGRVTDSEGKPLAGATIKVRGTNRQVLSDQAGEFTLPATDLNSTIEVTFVGHKTNEVIINGRDNIQVALQIALGQIDQIVVQAYGTTTKRLSTGNIATIDAKTIEQQPVTNPLQALSGRMAGVQVTQTSGIPGTEISVQIRGRNSIVAYNQPLYIVDGVPFAAESITGAGQISSVSPLSSINPNDIETISVLKDADATAIYGSRAANGVVLITTKNGTIGKTKLDVNLSRGYSNATRIAEVMSTSQFLQIRADAFANSNITPTESNAPDLMKWDSNVDNRMLNWYMGNTADVWDAGARFSGGNQQTSFLLSGSFHEENTMFSDQDKYQRANTHFALNHTSLNQKLNIKFNGIYAKDNNKVQNTLTATTNTVSRTIPNYPLFDAEGNYNWEANQTNYFAAAEAYGKTSTENLNLSMHGTYQITPTLQFLANVGYNRIFNQGMQIMPSTSKDPSSSSPLGSSVFRSANSSTYMFEPQLNYTRDFVAGKLALLLGSTIQGRESSTTRESVSNYLSDLLIESKNGGTVSSIGSTSALYNFLSVFARVNYNWKDRYILNASFRRDGSSRFGPGRRFGNFGSIGGAWLFSNESFLKDKTSWFSYGKLRGSYGTTGSDGIGDYGYLSLYGTTGDYGTQKAIIPSQIANDDYQWESTKKTEFALDLGFLKDRLLLSSVWYRNRSGNQLVTYPLPGTTGFTGYIANLPALVQNTGWEFELNSQNTQTKRQFQWITSFNITIPENKLLEFKNIEQTSYANTYVIGKPLNLFLGYQFESLDPDTGIPSVVDVSGNGTISSNSSYNGRGGDKIYIGTTDPKWYAGMNNSFTFKGLSLDIYLQYIKQQGYNLFSSQNGFSSFGTLVNGFTAYLDYWKEPGDTSQIPKPFAATNTAIRQYAESNKSFSDASFLRLKTLSLNYNLPGKWLNRVGLTDAQVFVLGQNLLTFSDFVGADPEQSSFNYVRQSTLKTVTIGFKSSL